MFDGIQAIWSGKCPAMGHAGSDKDPKLRARMIELREALGFKSGVEMARFLNVTYQRWMNVENGMPLGSAFAKLIKKKVPDVDLDWLIEGDPKGLPFDVRKALATFGGLAMPPPPPPQPRAPRRR